MTFGCNQQPTNNSIAYALAGGMPLEAYSNPSKWMHLIFGVSALSTVGLVVASQEFYPDWKDCSKEQKKVFRRFYRMLIEILDFKVCANYITEGENESYVLPQIYGSSDGSTRGAAHWRATC